MKKRVLVYTDSRGQHTPAGAPVHDVFAKRLAALPGLEVDYVLCPMKWTTTLDFLEFIEERGWRNYDHVILYTGIVDWSPRPLTSAVGQLYDNSDTQNVGDIDFDTRDYSRKVVNNKKALFDSVFGAGAVSAHLSSPFEVEYEGQQTVNLYSFAMAEEGLIPRLQEIENLIFINSNRFVPGWEGDFKRGRPQNMALTEEYSRLFRDRLGARVVDLLEWSDDEVKLYTCDNLHLTKAGSDWIFDRLIERIERQAIELPPTLAARPERPTGASFTFFGRPIEGLDPLSPAERSAVREACGISSGDPIATLIIGVRIPADDQSRIENLRFLLRSIADNYGDLFDVLLVEQDVEPQIEGLVSEFTGVRTEFLYNPDAFNRGWGYNVAVKHLTTLPVVGLLDTDVLLGRNFVDEVISCHAEFEAISPYANVYFTNLAEADRIRTGAPVGILDDQARIRKPTSLTGGILLIQRQTYLAVNGFEQYTGYGGEDRALDVTLLSEMPVERLRIAPYVYVHLFHPGKEVDETRLTAVLEHLDEYYQCRVDPTLTGADYIHQNCRHADQESIRQRIEDRSQNFADPDLYRRGCALAIDGMELDGPRVPNVIYPRTFGELGSYRDRELYNAPEPDVEKLEWFYNRFRGERCFIVGNGPSLNRHDLSLLQGEYSFAVNSIFYKTKETGYRPTFFVVEDNSVMKENLEEIRSYEAPYKFFPTIYKDMHPEGKNVSFFNMNRGFYEKTSPNYCVPRFSTDPTQVLYCGQSVTYINLQLAYFMGFSEVHLIGMDFDYVIPKEHRRKGDLILSTTDDPNHFHKEYFGVGKTWKDPKLDRVAVNYRMARLVYEAVGRQIYNATNGGKLEIFDRVDYDSLFPTGMRSGRATPPIGTLPTVSGKADQPTSRPEVDSVGKEVHADLISIIVPVYNVGEFLRPCLASLAAQDDQNFEVVLVDDGSTDESASEAETFANNDPRFRVFKQHNRGLGGARNTGLRHARGKFVTFVDSDDTVSPKLISTFRKAQSAQDADVVSARMELVREDGTRIGGQKGLEALPADKPDGWPKLTYAQKVLGVFLPSVSCARLYRRSLIMDNNFAFPERIPHEDFFFTYKVLGRSNVNVEIPDELYRYTQRSGSLSKTIGRQHVDTFTELMQDSARSLAPAKASPLDRIMAFRRILIFVGGLHTKALKSSSGVREYFFQQLEHHLPRLRQMVSSVRQFDPKLEGVRPSTIELVEGRRQQVRAVETGFQMPAYRAGDVRGPNLGNLQGIQAFRGRYAGKRCVIIGNGPSLNRHDLSLLKNEYTFGVNSFFYKTRETGFRPTFFVVEDNMVMKENLEEIKKYEVEHKFFPTDYANLHPADPNTHFFTMDQGFYLQSSPHHAKARFSADAADRIFCGQTVTYINMQLAFFMGFTEVYLIGMDFNYVIPKEHERQGNHIKSTTDDPNHFHKDYFGVGKTWKDPKLDRVALNYAEAKAAFESSGRRILNATDGGMLEMFPRVDFREVFGNTNERVVSLEVPAKAAEVPSELADSRSPESPRRPFYAEFGDRLRSRNPRIFGFLQILRRILVKMWARKGFVMAGFGLAPLWAVLLQLPLFDGYRGYGYGALVVSIVVTLVGYVGLRSYVAIRGLVDAFQALDRRVAVLSKSNEQLALSAQEIKIQSKGFRLDSQKELGVVRRATDILSSEGRRDRQRIEGVAVSLRTLSSTMKRESDRLLTQQSEIEGFQRMLADNESALKSFKASSTTLASRLEEALGSLRGELDQHGDHLHEFKRISELQRTKLSRLEQDSVGLDLVSAIRSLRPLWLGGSSSERSVNEVDIEHGHAMLMQVLADREKEQPGYLSGRTLIEIGITRELSRLQRSTQKLTIFSLLMDMAHVAIDMDPKNVARAKKDLPLLNPGVRVVEQKGEEFLRLHRGAMDFVYLDAFDFEHDNHSEARKTSYRDNLGAEITNEACWEMHANCAESVLAKMPVGGVVALDDTWREQDGTFTGKGKLAVPLLIDGGFRIVAESKTAVCLTREHAAN